MEANVWLQADETPGDAQQGDIVLKPVGDLVQVAEVDADGALQVHDEVATSLLPGLPEAGAQPQRISDEALLRAVRGVVTAERERGG